MRDPSPVAYRAPWVLNRVDPIYIAQNLSKTVTTRTVTFCHFLSNFRQNTAKDNPKPENSFEIYYVKMNLPPAP